MCFRSGYENCEPGRCYVPRTIAPQPPASALPRIRAVFIMIVTLGKVWLRLGCSLPPLGKPLVRVWKRKPVSGERVNRRVAQKFPAQTCRCLAGTGGSGRRSKISRASTASSYQINLLCSFFRLRFCLNSLSQIPFHNFICQISFGFLSGQRNAQCVRSNTHSPRRCNESKTIT